MNSTTDYSYKMSCLLIFLVFLPFDLRLLLVGRDHRDQSFWSQSRPRPVRFGPSSVPVLGGLVPVPSQFWEVKKNNQWTLIFERKVKPLKRNEQDTCCQSNSTGKRMLPIIYSADFSETNSIFDRIIFPFFLLFGGCWGSWKSFLLSELRK